MKTRKLLTVLLAIVASVCCAFGLVACGDKSTVKVTLDKTAIELTVGDSATLTATASDGDTDLTWFSSDETIATVADGVVTAVKEGTATVTVITQNNASATCTVTVKPIPVTGVTLDRSAVTLATGETVTLVATVAPDIAKNKRVTWTSSHEEFATVADGVVTAISEGVTTITATTEDGNFAATCEVDVRTATPGAIKAKAVEAEFNEDLSNTYGAFENFWYTFTAPSTGKLRVQVNASTVAVNQINAVVLTDSADTVLQQASDAKVLFYVQVTEGSKYYLHLSSTVNYAPTTRLEMVQDGDYKDIAKTMTFDEKDSLTLAAGKSKWYTFTVTEPTAITATLDGASDDVQVRFENRTAGVLGADYYKAGTYYVSVANTHRDKAATFTVTFAQAAISEDQIPEGVTKAKPYKITATFAGVKKLGLKKTHDTWFKISVETDHQVKILVNNDNGQNHDYVWYDGDTAEENSFVSDDSTQLSIVKDLKAGGTYYLQFKSSNVLSSYDVTFILPPSGKTLEEAITASVGNSYTVTEQDYWFAVKPTLSGEVVFYSKGNNTVSAQLCYANGTPTNDEDTDAGNNFRIKKSLTANVTYYLHVTTTDANPNFTVGIAKLGSSKDAAAVAQIGQSYSITATTYAMYWMAFTPTEDTELQISATGISTYNDVTINLFDYTLETPRIGGGSNSYAPKIEFTANLTANKTYHITFNGNCTVKLIVIKDGNDKSRPKTVAFGTADNVTMAAGEVVWYKFDVTAPAQVTATLSDPTDMQVAYEGKTAGETEVKYYEAGTYYVKVTNNGEASATLTVTFAQHILTADEIPEGMTKDKAFAVTVDYATEKSAVLNDALAHWFTFTLASDKAVDIVFVNSNQYAETTIDYVLYKGNAEVEDAKGSKYTYGSATVSQELTAGTYYLKVNRSAGTAGYTVQIKFPQDGSCREGAVSASVDKAYPVAVQDYWFTITPTSAQDVIIYSTGDNTVTAQLCDADGTPMGDEDKDAGNNFRIDKTLQADTTYYLHVTTSNAKPEFTVYFAKPGGSKELAKAATIGETYTLKLASSSDKYFYAFTAEKTGKVKISLSGSSLTSKLHKPDGTTESLSGYSPSVTVQFEQGKTYYLEMSASVYYSITCTVKTENLYGDSAENAQVAELGKSYSVTIEKSGNNYPMYYFSIELTEKTTVKISSSGSNYSEVKRQAIIADANEGTLKFCAAGEDNNFSAEYEFAANTKYLVKVGINATTSGFTGSSHSYSVKFELPPKTVDISTINAEVKTLPVSSTLTQGVHWYKVTLTGDNANSVYIHALNAEGGLVQPGANKIISYEIYNESGEFLQASNSSYLRYYLDGTYYIKVDYKGTEECTFKITFTDPTE